MSLFLYVILGHLFDCNQYPVMGDKKNVATYVQLSPQFAELKPGYQLHIDACLLRGRPSVRIGLVSSRLFFPLQLLDPKV